MSVCCEHCTESPERWVQVLLTAVVLPAHLVGSVPAPVLDFVINNADRHQRRGHNTLLLQTEAPSEGRRLSKSASVPQYSCLAFGLEGVQFRSTKLLSSTCQRAGDLGQAPGHQQIRRKKVSSCALRELHEKGLRAHGMGSRVLCPSAPQWLLAQGTDPHTVWTPGHSLYPSDTHSIRTVNEWRSKTLTLY
jgi:hypothetical protein